MSPENENKSAGRGGRGLSAPAVAIFGTILLVLSLLAFSGIILFMASGIQQQSGGAARLSGELKANLAVYAQLVLEPKTVVAATTTMTQVENKTMIILHSAWSDEVIVDHIVVRLKSGSILVDRDLSPPIRISPGQSVSMRPSDISPAMAAYDNDFLKFRNDVGEVILHVSTGDMGVKVSLSPVFIYPGGMPGVLIVVTGGGSEVVTVTETTTKTVPSTLTRTTIKSSTSTSWTTTTRTNTYTTTSTNTKTETRTETKTVTSTKTTPSKTYTYTSYTTLWTTKTTSTSRTVTSTSTERRTACSTSSLLTGYGTSIRYETAFATRWVKVGSGYGEKILYKTITVETGKQGLAVQWKTTTCMCNCPFSNMAFYVVVTGSNTRPLEELLTRLGAINLAPNGFYGAGGHGAPSLFTHLQATALLMAGVLLPYGLRGNRKGLLALLIVAALISSIALPATVSTPALAAEPGTSGSGATTVTAGSTTTTTITVTKTVTRGATTIWITETHILLIISTATSTKTITRTLYTTMTTSTTITTTKTTTTTESWGDTYTTTTITGTSTKTTTQTITSTKTITTTSTSYTHICKGYYSTIGLVSRGIGTKTCYYTYTTMTFGGVRYTYICYMERCDTGWVVCTDPTYVTVTNVSVKGTPIRGVTITAWKIVCG